MLRIHPPRAVLVSAAIAALAVLESFTPPSPADQESPSAHPGPPREPEPEPSCPVDTLPDQGVCIPVPRAEQAEETTPLQLELLPGRAEDYARYLTPLPAHVATRASARPGIFIAAPVGTGVTLISLEAQVGAARRITLRGRNSRLLTLHRTTRNGATRAYLLSYDGLAFDPNAPDTELVVGAHLGEVQGRPGVSGLELAVRQLRQGVDPDRVAVERLLRDSHSLACDPRNVLPPNPAQP